MRKINYIFAITFFLTSSVFGQKYFKNIEDSKQIDIFDNIWYKWKCDKEKQLNIPSFVGNSDYFHFRFWSSGQIVCIWSKDSNVFQGQLINYIYTKRPREKKEKKSFSNQMPIDTSTARQIFELWKIVSEIPTEDLIKNWLRIRTETTPYIFETSTQTQYSFKTYTLHSIQISEISTGKDSNFVEMLLTHKFVDTLGNILNLRNEYSKFLTTLKRGAYTTGSERQFYLIKYKNEKQAYKKAIRIRGWYE